jgi:D-ribulokinase
MNNDTLNAIVLGIDLGTQGARVLAVQADGTVTAAASEALRASPSDLPAGWFEQDPAEWWRAVRACLQQVMGSLPPGTPVAGISVDSTSGTILPVDALGQPLHPALMYSDQRSAAQARAVHTAGADLQHKLGYVFGASYGLPKILWLKEQRPDVFARTRWFLHAADFIAGQLSGEFGFSDTSNALKTGYDLVDLCWPDFIERDLGIPLERLPKVVLPGQPMGQVSARAAGQTGLAAGTPLYAGATDGTAAQLASGAAQPGEWNSTLGTTLVLKGISRQLRPDPLGRVYFHRHPEGWWMPGGASNTGTEWIAQEFPGAQISALDQQAESLLPTALLRYPLAKKGERFPFIHPDALGFTLGEPGSPAQQYAAGIEGMGLVERLAYDVLEQIGLEVGPRVYITGGGTRSLLWSRVRASVLGKTLLQPAVTETAFGAAVLAASGCWYGSASQAAQAMVTIAHTIQPDPQWKSVYNDRYAQFIEALEQRGYGIKGDG